MTRRSSFLLPQRICAQILPLVPPLFLATLAVSSCQKGGGSSSGSSSHDPLGDYIRTFPDPEQPTAHDDSNVIGNPYYPGDGIVCQEIQRSVTIPGINRPQLADHTDVIWPGSAVQGSSLAGGIPSPITAPRGPGDLVISNFTPSPSDSWRHLPEMKLGAVTQAINEIVNAQPEDFPADLQLSISQVRTREELQLALQASASYFDVFSADANFHWQDSVLTSKFLVTLEQNFFTIAFDRPNRITDFFAPGVTPNDLASQVDAGNPAGYISQVTYGRVFYLLIQTTTEATQAQAVLNANFLDLAEAAGSIQYATQLNNVEIEAYAYGGSQAEVWESVEAGLGSLEGFIQRLSDANNVHLAKPLSYIVRGLATNQVWKNAINAEYDYSDCSLAAECVPSLLSPGNGAVLDNGCTVDPNVGSWTFDWGTCDGAEQYELQILRGGQVQVDRLLEDSAYTHPSNGALPASGWQWKVRAKRFGAWNPWTTPRNFSLEPANTDCVTKIRVYTHPDYAGDYTDFTSDIPNLEDVPGGMDDDIDSLHLYNVRGVWLYEHPNYQGASFFFDHDCPDVEFHPQHANQFRRNWASSLRIVL